MAEPLDKTLEDLTLAIKDLEIHQNYLSDQYSELSIRLIKLTDLLTNNQTP